MFCIYHNACGKSGDNGNCSVYPVSGVSSSNTGRRVCGFLDESVLTFGGTKKTGKMRIGQQKQRKGVAK